MTSKGVAGTICGCLASGGGGAGAATCLKSTPKPKIADKYNLHIQNAYQQTDDTNIYFDFGHSNCVKELFDDSDVLKNTTQKPTSDTVHDEVILDKACFVFDIAHNQVQDKYVVAAKFELTAVDASNTKGVAIQTVLSNAQATDREKLVYVTRVHYLTGTKTGEHTTWALSKGFEFRNKKIPSTDQKNLNISILGHGDKMKVSGNCDSKCILGNKPKILKGFFQTSKESQIQTHLYRAIIEQDDSKNRGVFFDAALSGKISELVEGKKSYQKDKGWTTSTDTIVKDPIKVETNFKFTWTQEMWGSFNDMSDSQNITYQIT